MLRGIISRCHLLLAAGHREVGLDLFHSPLGPLGPLTSCLPSYTSSHKATATPATMSENSQPPLRAGRTFRCYRKVEARTRPARRSRSWDSGLADFLRDVTEGALPPSGSLGKGVDTHSTSPFAAVATASCLSGK